MAANPALAAALARLTPEERKRLSRANAAAIIAAIDELVVSRRPQQPAGPPQAPHATPARS
jgi:hypothetical protein